MGAADTKVKMTSSFLDSTVLITGGTGSFGSTMARHALERGVAELRIFSRDEAKQEALRHQLSDARVKYIIGDTRDVQSVNRATKGANLVFHAAALKQVPTAEFFPLEAVKTNVLGSENVLRASLEHEVDGVVCLSTDKAVYPINAMGMSKALMEKTAQAFARDNLDAKTRIAVTRYGNVMYSRGSVIPRFIEQISSGRPITITDPSMTRFLMSLGESVDLVEHAFTNAKSGDLFVRKAPAATIQTISEALIRIFSTSEHPKEIIGFRHGEKLYETLLSVEERFRAEDEGQYYRVPLDARDLNYDVYFEQGDPIPTGLEPYTSHNTHRLDTDDLEKLLKTLPEIRETLK